MPQFNWRLLLDKQNDRKIFVIGACEDARPFCALANEVYLLSEGGLDACQEPHDAGLVPVRRDAIAALSCDYVIVFHPVCKTKLDLLRGFTSDTHHVLHYYKDSSLRERLQGCLAIFRDREKLLFFPYSSFKTNHFTDLFRKPIRLNQLKQLLKHVLRRKEFGLYAPKRGRKSNIEDIIQHIQESHKIDIATPTRFRNGTTGSFLADLGTLIVRIPYTDSSNEEFCKNNFSILQKLRGMDLPFPVPAPVGAGVLKDANYYIESKIQGSSLDLTTKDAQDPQVVEAIFKIALEALGDPRMKAGTLTEKNAQELIEREMKGLVEYLSEEQIQLYGRFALAFGNLARQVEIPLVITHGDFKNANFIISEGESPAIRGVIDWEFSPLVWFPLYDVLLLIAHRFHSWKKGPHELVQYVFALAQGREKRAEVFLNQYLQRFDLDTSLALPLMVLCMLRYMNVSFFAKYRRFKKEKFWANVFVECIDPMTEQFLRSAK